MKKWLALLTFILLAAVPWSALISSGVDLSAMNAMPSTAHPLGTDNLGRDLLVRLAAAVHGATLPLWFATLGAALVGTLLGACYCRLDAGRAFSKFGQAALTLPVLVAAIPVFVVVFAGAVWQQRAGLGPVLMGLTPLITIRSGLLVTELYRRDALLGYWSAHAAVGGSLNVRLWRYGILGSWREPILTALAFHLSIAVSIEASLSYLGFGIEEPQASFGNMLAAHFDQLLHGQWHVPCLVAATLALTTAVPRSLMRCARNGNVF